jgi:hypothetical protein
MCRLAKQLLAPDVPISREQALKRVVGYDEAAVADDEHATLMRSDELSHRMSEMALVSQEAWAIAGGCDHVHWTNFYMLTELEREAKTGGFELLGRKPASLPDLTGRKRAHAGGVATHDSLVPFDKRGDQ